MDEKREGKINILFVSDLHYGLCKVDDNEIDYDCHRFTRKKVLDELLSFLAENYKSSHNRNYPNDNLEKIDVIAIGGDVGWSGKKKDYQEFKDDFLSKIQEYGLVDSDKIVICMGNHDLNRGIAQKHDLARPTAGDFKDIPDNLNLSDVQTMRKRFKHFEAATKAFAEYGITPLENSYTVTSKSKTDKQAAAYVYGYRQPIPGVHFVVLNSAWDHRADDRDPLDTTKKIPTKGRLRVGLDTYEDTERFLQSARLCGKSERYYTCMDKAKNSCRNCSKRTDFSDVKGIFVATGVTITMFHHPFYSINRLGPRGDFNWLHDSETIPDETSPGKNYLSLALSENTDIIFNGHTHITESTEPLAELLTRTDKRLPVFMSGALYSNDTYVFGCWIISLHYVEEAKNTTVRAYRGYTARKLRYINNEWISEDYLRDNRERFVIKTVRESLISLLQSMGRYAFEDKKLAMNGDIATLIAALIERVLALSRGLQETPTVDKGNRSELEDSSALPPRRYTIDPAPYQDSYQLRKES